LTPEAKKGIGDRIRHARINAKMKQYDTAEKIGVSRAAVSNWELGLGYWRAWVALTISRLTQPLVSPKSTRETGTDQGFNCRLDHSRRDFARAVERNVAAFRHPVPADLWAELKHEKLIRADAPTPA
jgi:DNA-binding XRE family transcriptional regulator